MPSQISIHAAKKLQDKIDSATCPLAVFASYGTWSATKVSTRSFDDQVRLKPHTLMGVYDVNARLEDIASDFDSAGIK